MQKKGLSWLIKIYLIMLLGVAMIAPFCYICVLKLSDTFHFNWLQYLAHKPLCQYIDRLRLVGFICVIPYLLKTAQIAWGDLSLKFNFKIYFCCFLKGCILWISLLTCVICATKELQFKSDCTFTFFKYFLASLCLAFLEEFIFRGVVFEFLRKKYVLSKTLFFLAFLFSSLHFSLCRENGLLSSSSLILQSLQCVWHSILDIWGNIHWAYFFSLFFLSKILVFLRLCYNSLWAAIGFHQGLVFILMCIRHAFIFNTNQNTFWGTGRLTDSWFVVFVLIFICTKLKRSFYKKLDNAF